MDGGSGCECHRGREPRTLAPLVLRLLGLYVVRPDCQGRRRRDTCRGRSRAQDRTRGSRGGPQTSSGERGGMGGKGGREESGGSRDREEREKRERERPRTRRREERDRRGKVGERRVEGGRGRRQRTVRGQRAWGAFAHGVGTTLSRPHLSESGGPFGVHWAPTGPDPGVLTPVPWIPVFVGLLKFFSLHQTPSPRTFTLLPIHFLRIVKAFRLIRDPHHDP